MDRKAQVLGYFVSIAIIIAVVMAVMLINTIKPKDDARFPGEVPLSMLKAAQYETKINTYISESVGLVEKETLQELADAGGSKKECGAHLTYNLWGKSCPNDINDNFEQLLNAKLTSWLAIYPEQGKSVPLDFDHRYSVAQDIKSGHFKVYAANKKLLGMRNTPANINIFTTAKDKNQSQVGAYQFRPQFERESQYNYEQLQKIQDFMKLLTNEEPVTPNIGYEGLRINAGGCAPTKPEELFYDVVEKMQWCALAAEESCTCDIAQTDLQLLGEKYSIEFQNNNGVVAYLKDKSKQGAEGEIIAYRFEESFALGRMHAGAELKPLVLDVNSATLEWKRPDASSVLESVSEAVFGSSPETNMFSWVGDGKDTQTISIEKGLFHEKKEGITKIGFAIDRQRSNPSDPYNQLPQCTLPSLKKFRMCIDEGKINDKPLQFKIAVETS